jgi:hypothetical protein
MPSIAEFYSGSMTPPDKGPNGTLVQSRQQRPSSIADMYSETGGQAPATRSVQTTKVTPKYATGRPADIIESKPAPIFAQSKPTTVDAAMPIDVNRLGLTTSPFDTPAAAAIATAAPSGGIDPIGAGPLGFGEMLGRMFDPSWSSGPVLTPSDADPWVGSRVVPKDAPTPGLVTGSRNPVAALASGPARTNPKITYNHPLARVGDNRPTVLGMDMAFMPKSVQQSSRWNTGY